MPEERSSSCRTLREVFLGEPQRRAGVRIVGVEVFEQAAVLRWDVEGDPNRAVGLRDNFGRVYQECVASRENDVLHEGRIRGRTVFAPSPRGDVATLVATFGELSVSLTADALIEDVRDGTRAAIRRVGDGRASGMRGTIAEIYTDSVCLHWHYVPPALATTIREPPELALTFGQRYSVREEQKAWLRTSEAFIGSSQFLVPDGNVAGHRAELVVGDCDALPLW